MLPVICALAVRGPVVRALKEGFDETGETLSLNDYGGRYGLVSDDGVRLERRVHLNALYDFYAPLLTERQRDVYEMRYFSDLSLAEIAETLNITRQAVHILVNRTAERLEALERDLGFAARLEHLENRIRELEARCPVERCEKQEPPFFKEKMRYV
jgi:predicted DNA-binding protein YlxM (UPF0122 family)